MREPRHINNHLSEANSIVQTTAQTIPEHRQLQVAVAVGMPVCELGDGMPGIVVGITEAYCIYRIDATETLCVRRWREIGLGNICPAPTLLPTDVNVNDRHNASATLLRELLALEHVASLTTAQQTTLCELTNLLCSN